MKMKVYFSLYHDKNCNFEYFSSKKKETKKEEKQLCAKGNLFCDHESKEVLKGWSFFIF